MIHDTLLILWDCSEGPVQTEKENLLTFANEGDVEIYNNICDVAKSHRRIHNYLESTGFRGRFLCSASSQKIYGLYTQSLSEGITEVLRSYKKTLVEVEQLVIDNHNYTLSFVYSYVEQFRGLFNTLNRIISTIKERRLVGCQILSLVHQYILNGNERVHDAIVRIFTSMNEVFINQLCSWLLYGELKDPYQEFFIFKNREEASDTLLSSPSTVNTTEKSLISTLQDTTLDCGYALNANHIPYFVPLSLAQEILFIGKTVVLFGFDPKKTKRGGFVNRSVMTPMKCGADSRRFTIWEEKEAEFHEKLQRLKQPEVFEVCNLRAVVREIKDCVTKHLWTVAVEEAHLVHELQLLKDFFLVGRGELFLELLRRADHLLDQPTTRTSTRDMNHAFQQAARAVFLTNNPDIDKFSLELPYNKNAASPNSGQSVDDDSSVSDGWSSIILKYEFKWPLHLLFTAAVLARYNDMFRLLLRIKKTQHDLHVLWKTHRHSTSWSVCQLHNKLMFVIEHLQRYLQADVLDANHTRLLDAVRTSRDFERVKRAHATFLADVLTQSFLSAEGTESECSSESGDTINNPVLCHILELLKLCHAFCSMSQTEDKEAEDYYVRGYSDRFEAVMGQLLRVLGGTGRDGAARGGTGQGGGSHLARLLMRLDYNRWLTLTPRARH